MDGSLNILSVYEVLDSEDLGLGVGKTYARNNGFLGDDDFIPLGIGIVVTPSPESSNFLIPAAYPIDN